MINEYIFTNLAYFFYWINFKYISNGWVHADFSKVVFSVSSLFRVMSTYRTHILV